MALAELANINNDGTVPVSRIKNAQDAYAIYIALRDADIPSSRDRAKIQAMYDGEPPYSKQEQIDAGRGDACNVDMGEAFAEKEAALASYSNLIYGVDQIAAIETEYGDDLQRAAWNQVLSEEFHRLLTRDWSQFHFRYQKLCEKFVGFGVGIMSFDDNMDWRFYSDGFDSILIPMDTEAYDESVEILIRTRQYQPHHLYAWIKDEETALELGWNIEAVRTALMRAVPPQTEGPRVWEQFQRILKDNDLYVSYAKPNRIKLNHYLVREFDGTYSHHIGMADGSVTEYLYSKIGRFKKANEAFIFFPFGIGNGDFHSIRGQGFKMYDSIQLGNKMYNHMFDSTIRSTSVIVQPNSAEDLQDLSLTYLGSGITAAPPGLKFVPNAIPNLSKDIIPIVSEISRIRQNNLGSYQSRDINPDGQSRTLGEAKLQANQESTLSETALNLFYVPWEKGLREMWRRVARRDYQQTEPGGREVMEFKRRVLNRGVPAEAIYAVRSVRAVRSIGYGSPSRRMIIEGQMMELLPFMDEAGRNTFARKRISSYGDNPDYYIPRVDAPSRPPIDQHIAELQNIALQQGQSQSVLPNDNHVIHADVHLSAMAQVVQAYEQQTQQGGGSQPQGQQQIMTFLQAGLQHAQQHIQQFAMDKTRESDLQKAEQAFTAISKVFKKIQQELQAQAQKAALEQASKLNQPQQDPKIAMEAAKMQAKIQLDQQKAAADSQIDLHDAQQKATIRQQEASQKMQIKDAEAAQKLKHEREAQKVAQAAPVKKPAA